MSTTSSGKHPPSGAQVGPQGGAGLGSNSIDNKPVGVEGTNGMEEYVVAMWGFQGSAENELTFVKGDKIKVLIKHNQDWYEGEVNNQKGLFPANRVKPLSPQKSAPGPLGPKQAANKSPLKTPHITWTAANVVKSANAIKSDGNIVPTSNVTEPNRNVKLASPIKLNPPTGISSQVQTLVKTTNISQTEKIPTFKKEEITNAYDKNNLTPPVKETSSKTGTIGVPISSAQNSPKMDASNSLSVADSTRYKATLPGSFTSSPIQQKVNELLPDIVQKSSPPQQRVGELKGTSHIEPRSKKIISPVPIKPTRNLVSPSPEVDTTEIHQAPVDIVKQQSISLIQNESKPDVVAVKDKIKMFQESPKNISTPPDKKMKKSQLKKKKIPRSSSCPKEISATSSLSDEDESEGEVLESTEESPLKTVLLSKAKPNNSSSSPTKSSSQKPTYSPDLVSLSEKTSAKENTLESPPNETTSILPENIDRKPDATPVQNFEIEKKDSAMPCQYSEKGTSEVELLISDPTKKDLQEIPPAITSEISSNQEIKRETMVKSVTMENVPSKPLGIALPKSPSFSLEDSDDKLHPISEREKCSSIPKSISSPQETKSKGFPFDSVKIGNLSKVEKSRTFSNENEKESIVLPSPNRFKESSPRTPKLAQIILPPKPTTIQGAIQNLSPESPDHSHSPLFQAIHTETSKIEKKEVSIQPAAETTKIEKEEGNIPLTVKTSIKTLDSPEKVSQVKEQKPATTVIIPMYPWAVAYTNDGKPYYYNQISNEVTWDLPPEAKPNTKMIPTTDIKSPNIPNVSKEVDIRKNSIQKLSPTPVAPIARQQSERHYAETTTPTMIKKMSKSEVSLNTTKEVVEQDKNKGSLSDIRASSDEIQPIKPTSRRLAFHLKEKITTISSPAHLVKLAGTAPLISPTPSTNVQRPEIPSPASFSGTSTVNSSSFKSVHPSSSPVPPKGSVRGQALDASSKGPHRKVSDKLVSKVKSYFGTSSQSFYPGNAKMASQPQDGTNIFGGRLESILEKEQKRIPSIVQLCTKEVEKRGLDVCGIYRLSGSVAEINRLKELFNNMGAGDMSILEVCDIHAITGLLKMFFRQLEDPIFTYSLYGGFIQASKIDDSDDRLEEVKRLLSLLPRAHQDTLHYLIMHLLKVVDKSEENKMASSNLSIVFGPTLLRSATLDVESVVLDTPYQGRLMDILLSHSHYLFS